MPEETKRSLTFEEISDAPEGYHEGTNYLFVIGINEYEHYPKLKNAVKDARDVVAVLTDKYQFDPTHTYELYNQEANEDGITDKLVELGKTLSEDDNLVIYFSGHGHQDQHTREGYWIPIDARPNRINDYIPNSTILNYIKACKARHIFLISDACFSGALFVNAESRSANVFSQRISALRSRWGLTSGRQQVVSDGTPGQNSPFATALLSYLRNNELDNQRVSSLVRKVEEVVSANAEQIPHGNPLVNTGHKGGEYIFRLRKNEIQSWTDTAAKDSLEAYQTYLTNFPDGKYADIARKRIREIEEDQRWEEACEHDTLSSYRDYMARYPLGRHKEEAQTKIKELEKLSAEEFRLREEARTSRQLEDEAWLKATKANYIEAYNHFLSEYPNGRHASAARSRIFHLQNAMDEERQKELENEAWNFARQLDSRQSYEDFLNQYGEGRYAAEAHKRLLELRKLEAAQKKEDQIWQVITEDGTPKAYQVYLEHYPEGKYAHQAREKLAGYKKETGKQVKKEVKKKKQPEPAPVRNVAAAQKPRRNTGLKVAVGIAVVLILAVAGVFIVARFNEWEPKQYADTRAIGETFQVAYVSTQGSPLNLRSGPGTDYGIIYSIPNREKVKVLDSDFNPRRSSWVEVEYAGYSGYVYSEYLSKRPEISSSQKEDEMLKRQEERARAAQAEAEREQRMKEEAAVEEPTNQINDQLFSGYDPNDYANAPAQPGGTMDANTMFGYGYYYYMNGYFPESFNFFYASARKGNSNAQCMVGYMYLYGIGTYQNYNAGVQFLKVSARNGNYYAQNMLMQMGYSY